MAMILDADVVIGGEGGVFDLAAWAASRPNDLFEVAAITVAELWHGVERAVEPPKSKRRKYLETIAATLPVTRSKRHMSTRASELQVSGKVIGACDLIVAATALERGSQVATFNKRHFALVKGVHLLEPR
jgi:tRNA(fMet)-specific endonuclease VapC